MTKQAQKHPLTWFFTLTFAATWGLCSFLLVNSKPDALQSISPAFIIIAICSGLVPSVAACLLALMRGEAKSLFAQVKTGSFWRFTPALLLIVPAATIISYLLSSPLKMHLNTPQLVMGLVWPLFSSFGEEFGWRGFALPKLIKQRGFTYAALSIGLIWGLWHLPMDYIGLRSHGWLFIPEFILVGPAILTAHSIIMAYFYVRSNGNLLLMIAYHYTITASAIILPGLFATSEAVGLANLLQPLLANVLLWIPAGFILWKRPEVGSQRTEDRNQRSGIREPAEGSVR